MEENKTMTTNVKENKDERAKALYLLNELKRICKSHDTCIDCPLCDVSMDKECLLKNIYKYRPSQWKIKKLDLRVVDVDIVF